MFNVSVTLSRYVTLGAVATGLVLSYQPILLTETLTKPTIVPHIPTTEETRLEVSLSRRQVTLYQMSNQMKIYPVAIGSPEWETPTGTFRITQMIRNPAWRNPLTGFVIPPGHPANPLGHYWIGFWTHGPIWYGFHGTNDPESIGKAVSHGCLRMYNQDVEELFSLVKLGTEVIIVP